MKFENWAYLNEDGKKLLGHVFPNGIVPIKNILFPLNVDLSDKDGKVTHKNARVFLIDWNELTEQQKKDSAHLIAERNNINDDIMFSKFSEQGFILLRSELVSFVGAGVFL